MKHNIEKIKVLDIDVDFQSSYFLLPQNGVYQEYEKKFYLSSFIDLLSCSNVRSRFAWI